MRSEGHGLRVELKVHTWVVHKSRLMDIDIKTVVRTHLKRGLYTVD